ncbi:MAG TPA: hypothetical protein VGD68_15325 [Streptosporangiaceae bacterium]
MKRLLALLMPLTLVMLLVAGCSKSSPAGSAGSGSASSGAASSGAAPSGSSAASGSAVPTSCPTEATGFAKTKFVTHAALGFGAFHRYIYKPFRAGTFRSGAHGRITAFIKAGLAALFIKREVRLAGDAAQNSPALCKAILSPLRTVSETVQDAVSKLRQGDASGVGAIQSAVSQVESQASSHGSKITENSNAPLS